MDCAVYPKIERRSDQKLQSFTDLLFTSLLTLC